MRKSNVRRFHVPGMLFRVQHWSLESGECNPGGSIDHDPGFYFVPSRLHRWASKGTLFDITLVAVTVGLVTGLSYAFYHALQNVRVL